MRGVCVEWVEESVCRGIGECVYRYRAAKIERDCPGGAADAARSPSVCAVSVVWLLPSANVTWKGFNVKVSGSG